MPKIDTNYVVAMELMDRVAGRSWPARVGNGLVRVAVDLDKDMPKQFDEALKEDGITSNRGNVQDYIKCSAEDDA